MRALRLPPCGICPQPLLPDTPGTAAKWSVDLLFPLKVKVQKSSFLLKLMLSLLKWSKGFLSK